MDGVILFSGHHEFGDYIALCMNMGFLEFTFDLGSGVATVRSEFPISLGQWITIKVSRTARLAVMKVDKYPEVMIVSPNGFWHLSLPHSLFIGGVQSTEVLPSNLRERGSFIGCIQKIEVNDKDIDLIEDALGGADVENCEHACISKPCGKLAYCIPKFDNYECQCNPQNEKCNHAEEVSSEALTEEIEKQKKQVYHKNTNNVNSIKKTKRVKNLKNGSKDIKNEKYNFDVVDINEDHTSRSFYIDDDVDAENILLDEMEKVMKDGIGSKKTNLQNRNNAIYRHIFDSGFHDRIVRVTVKKKNRGTCFPDSNSYYQFKDEDTLKKIIYNHIDLNLRFKTLSSNGLILWTGRYTNGTNDDYLSLGIENG